MVDLFISLKSISTGDKCVLTFKPCGMFGKELHRVEGYIQDRRYEHVRSDTVGCDRSSPNGISLIFVCLWISKKKRRVIYGKWTECMYSVDPRVYETYRKSDKRAAGDSKKLRTVSRPQRVDWHMRKAAFQPVSVCLWHVLLVLHSNEICDSAFVLK